MELPDLQCFKSKAYLNLYKDAPTWFAIEGYKGFHWKNPAFWYEQISIRKNILSFLTLRTRGQPKEAKAHYYKLINQIQKKPVLDLENAEDILRFGGPRLLYVKKNLPDIGTNTASFKELTIQDLSVLQKKSKQKKNSSKVLQKLGLQDFQLPVFINMALPDDVLVDQLREFLKKARHTHSKISSLKSSRKNMLHNWNANALIPYLDLVIWSLQNKTCISWTLMAEMLFGDRSRAVDVRMTVKDIAEHALSHQSLEVLYSQSVSERK